MAKDVLITPLDGIIQFSSSAGTGSGQIKVDGDDLVVSNLIGDVLLGDGASDIYIGDGTNNVDIIFEQNGEIRDDGSGKSITLGSKTTNVFITGSDTISIQKDGGNVGIGKTAATKTLEVAGDISGSGNLNIQGSLTASGHISASIIRAKEIRDHANGHLTIRPDADLNLGTAGTDEINIGRTDSTTCDLQVFAGDSSPTLRIVNKSAIFAHPVTASADISSSGTITANAFVGGITGTVTGTATGLAGTPDIVVGSLTATSITSSIVTSSIIHTEGSNIFGDTIADTHKFNGHITASGNISASGKIYTTYLDLDGSGINITNDSSTELNFNGTNNTNITTAGNMYIKAGSSKKMYFGANATDSLVTLDTNGNVGIGTTSPTEELDLRGELFISSSATGVNPILIKNSVGTNSLKLATDANQHNDFYIYKAGASKIRLGTYWPSIIDPDYYETNGGLILGDDATTSTNRYGLYVSDGPDSGSAYFAESVGIAIGGAAPTAKLDVNGNINTTSHITASGNISSSGTGSFGKMTIGTSTMVHANTQLTVAGGHGGYDFARFTRTDTGTSFVGINANASDPQIRFYEGSDYAAIGVDATNSNLVFATGSKVKDKEAMVINTDGDVGIGTTTPQSELHVEGDISASGDVTIGDDLFVNGGVVQFGTNTTIQDSAGEGYLAFGSNLIVDIGDTGGSANSTILSIDDNNNKVTVTGDAPQVVIGGTSPTTNQELTVVGDIYASGNISGSVTSTGSFGEIKGAPIWVDYPFRMSTATYDRYYFRDVDDPEDFRQWDAYDTSPTAIDYRGVAGQYVIPEDCTLTHMRGIVSNTGISTVNPTIYIFYGTITEGTGTTTLASASNGTEPSIGTARAPYGFSEDFNLNLSAGQIVIPMVKHSWSAATQGFQGNITLRYKTR